MAGECFVIYGGDGRVYLDRMKKTELESRLNNDYYGEVVFRTEFPENKMVDLSNISPGTLVIFPCAPIAPRQVELVTRYAVE